MMKREIYALTSGLVLLAAVEIVAASGFASFFFANHYLPSPFIYDKQDTFMDFFNPMFWAGEYGVYSVWGAVYPPINFLVLGLIKTVFLGGEHFANGFELRAHAPLLALGFVLLAAVSMILMVRCEIFARFTRLQKTLIVVIGVLSAPFLFAIERGNLIVFTVPLLVWALSSRRWGRAVALALLVNIKFYFAPLFLVYLVKWRPDWLVRAGALATALFLLSGVLTDPDFLLSLPQLATFASEPLWPLNDLLTMAANLDVYRYAVDFMLNYGVRFGGYVYEAELTSAAIRLTPVVMGIAALAFMGIARNRVGYREALFVLTVLIMNLSASAGGYVSALLIAVFPVAVGMRFAPLYLACIAAVLLPLDSLTVLIGRDANMVAYLSGARVHAVETIGIGSFIRPLINFALMAGLTFEMLARATRATIERYGWLDPLPAPTKG